MAPLATYRGISGYLDNGWDAVEPVLENSLAYNDVTCLALTDSVDNADTLDKTLTYCQERGATLVTLTQIATITG